MPDNKFFNIEKVFFLQTEDIDSLWQQMMKFSTAYSNIVLSMRLAFIH